MEIDKEVCRRLYHCLCETIGSEEVVSIRREFYSSVDYFTERKEFTLISSGSRAEGLEMGSDIDIMWLFKFVHISEEKTEDSFLIPNNIVMDTGECKPCFSQLKGYSCHYDTVVNWVLTPHGQELRLESGHVRYLLLSITRLFRPFNSHGPCVSDETEKGLCDLTVCLRCPVWINLAQPWIKRERYWPAPSLVSLICNYVICCKLKAVNLQISRPFMRVFGVISILYSPVRQLYRGQLFIKRFLKLASKDFMPFIVFSEFCQLIGKSMDIHINCLNKLKYKSVKQYLPYLFLGLRVDAVSSWMYLATFYYCIGKYKVSLQLIYHALRECTSDKLFYVNNKLTVNRFSEFVKEGIRQKIWKLRHLYKNHVIHEISFYYNSRVIPPELGVQFTTAAYIPPLVYIQFLRFLCLFRLHEDFQCKQAIQDLLLSIYIKHFNSNESVFGEAYKCLAVAFAIYGKMEEARYYFAAYDLYKERFKDLYF
ncbi:unnamed protein product [Mytilus coruscus]|uniref:Mab-21-like HhH/H2TH-like domain-containing protein n=1 Tax=Mytilus coruscus TaxID=42192 RepID=A0A6J8CFT0_MYTCO|nr:unnamed protein product [Mytilus coruscus]